MMLSNENISSLIGIVGFKLFLFLFIYYILFLFLLLPILIFLIENSRKSQA